MFDEFVLGRGETFFRYVGIFPRLPPQNPSVESGETRDLRRWIGFDSYVRNPVINTDPPTGSLNLISPRALHLSVALKPSRAVVLLRHLTR